MASRPPEGNGSNDDEARKRWMVINAVRMSGLAMALIGIMGLGSVFDYPRSAAYVLVVVGLVDFFVMPLLLARKWRTPEP